MAASHAAHSSQSRVGVGGAPRRFGGCDEHASTWHGLDAARGRGLVRALAARCSRCCGCVALVGFALRYRRYGRDLDSWMCLGSDARRLRRPAPRAHARRLERSRAPGRLPPACVAYGVLLVGVWRAIGEAEFGRAVADERARVARRDPRRPRAVPLRDLDAGEHARGRRRARRGPAAPEARGDGRAAGGALRRPRALVGGRYRRVRLGAPPLRRGAHGGRRAATSSSTSTCRSSWRPDEQIEVFRIVQEGPRQCAPPRGREPRRRRRSRSGPGDASSRSSDDGVGFDESAVVGGQGVDEHARRAHAAIDGRADAAFRNAGAGPAIEVVLRPRLSVGELASGRRRAAAATPTIASRVTRAASSSSSNDPVPAGRCGTTR